MSMTKSKDSHATHFSDYKKFRSYMRKEAYWHHMHGEEISQILLLKVDGHPFQMILRPSSSSNGEFMSSTHTAIFWEKVRV